MRRASSEAEAPSTGDVVRALVGRIPRGRVATYGAVGRAAVIAGRPVGGARTVAWILASLKGTEAVPWHRVVGAGGRILLPDRRGATQRRRLREEGVVFTGDVIEPARLIAPETLLRSRRT